MPWVERGDYERSEGADRDRPMMRPGVHVAMLKDVFEPKGKNKLIIAFENQRGERAIESMKWMDDQPEPGAGWKFFRVLGACDYPDVGYWETPIEEREERAWSIRDMQACIGRSCILVIEHVPPEKVGGKLDFFSIRRMYSVVRNPDQLPAAGEMALGDPSEHERPYTQQSTPF